MVQLESSIYQYSIPRLNSEEVIALSDFKGKKILFVNVASRCGYTPQYAELQKLSELYADQLVVIALPCNQFFFQESGSESAIERFCENKYGVTFPITKKIKVKGSNKHPIYQWLTSKELNKKGDYVVSWNFNKFLVSENGELLAHFDSKALPLGPEITSYLNK